VKVFDSDGREVSWNYAKYYSRRERGGKSKGHILARSIIKELFPFSTLYEEVTLPTSPAMFADFFLPDKRIIFEVHGEQHYEYNPFFHKSKMDFYKSKNRDKTKRQWCESNSILIIELPHNKEKEWKQIILNSILA
jgi:hypothetical protein